MRVITLNDDEALINYAQPIGAELRANRMRVDSDFSATPFTAKIAEVERSGSYPPLHVRGYGSSSAGVNMEAGAANRVCVAS